MALTPRSGSPTSPSIPNTVQNEIPNTQGDVLPHMPFVSDSQLNKYAIDTSQYANATKSLIGVMKGKRVNVTYYRLLGREGSNNRTNIADLPSARNVIDSEYHKILNLEITLPKGLEFNANNAQASMSMKGEAMFYPNMNPSIGDIFLMGTGDGRVGVCRVSSVTPMSWRADRIYLVDFVVHEFSDPSNHDPIEGSVTLTSVFSKENYLGGTAALLSELTYVQLLKIREIRANLCKYYHLTFFNKNICSYVHPDTSYDPWVVQYMANKLSMDDVNIRPKNLLGQKPELYQRTIWSRLEDRFNNTLYGIHSLSKLMGYGGTRMSVFNTELHNRSILYPTDDAGVGRPYIFTSNFYTNKPELMTAEELRFYNAITLRDAGDLSTLIATYLEPVFTTTPEQQFYRIPLYIHLIDMALQNKYREIDAPSMGFSSTAGE